MPNAVLRERPEQTFFNDPALDRVLSFAFALGAEVWVLRDRVARLEAALTAHGALPADAAEAAPPAPPADRAEFVRALMEGFAARQRSNGPG